MSSIMSMWGRVWPLVPSARCRATRLSRKLEIPVLAEPLESRMMLSGSTSPGFSYQTDFEAGAGAEWSNRATDIAPASGTKFLGQFSNQTVTLTLPNVPTNRNLQLQFDLFLIRSWDGNDTTVRNGESLGPDVWDLTIPGVKNLLHTTFDNFPDQDQHRQAYPDDYPGGDNDPEDGALPGDPLGFDTYGSSVYHMTYTVQSQSPTLVLNFSASGLQVITDESWGLDNVKVATLLKNVAVTSKIMENGTATLTGEIANPDPDNTTDITIDWRDGLGSDPTDKETFTLPAGAKSFTRPHKYLDDGPYPGNGTTSDVYAITVALNDDGYTDKDTVNLEVDNVAPKLQNVVLSDDDIDENDYASIEGDIVDPGTQDIFTVTIDWADSNPQHKMTYEITFDPDNEGTTHFEETYQYLDDGPYPGQNHTESDKYTIHVSVKDDDNGTDDGSSLSPLVLTVNNVPPTLDNVSVSPNPVDPGKTVTLTAEIEDPGTKDDHNGMIYWGEGNPVPYNLAAGDLSISGTHSYSNDGAMPVTFHGYVTVRDDDYDGTKAEAKQPFDVTVKPSPFPPPTPPPGKGAISGRVFNDANLNGVIDAAESGLVGWTVFLDSNKNGKLDTGEPSMASGAGGYYVFNSLAPGVYRVRDILQSGWRGTVPSAGYYDSTVTSGVVVTARNFGNTQEGSLTGRVFNDVNANGVLDAGEVPLAACQVFLDTNKNGVLDSGEPSTLSAADGSYLFDGLLPGAFRVSETPKTGWRATLPATGYYDVAVASGAVVTAKIFGNTQKGLVTGTVFNDANVNAVNDAGDSGLSGWTVFLDTNKNGILDTGETSVTSAADGSYSFGNLVAGAYRIREVAHGGWRGTAPTAAYYDVTIASGASITARNFGNTQKAQLSGTVFNDLNANGMRDSGEPALSGIKVYVDSNNNGRFDAGEITAVTNASGLYQVNVAAGSYIIRQVLPAGIRQTLPTGGAGRHVTVAASAILGGQDFSEATALAGISGIAYHDFNGNGAIDTGERNLPGWTVFLDTNGNGLLDSGEKSAVTNSAGAYQFTGLAAGTYRVRQVVKSGWVATPKPGGYYTVVLAGLDIAGRNFSDARAASIAGSVFLDADGDGALDGTEGGLAGVTVFLDANNNGVLDTGESSAASSATGAYAFNALTPGAYVVRAAPQSAFVATTPPGGSFSITLVSGLGITGANFGNAPRTTTSAPASGAGATTVSAGSAAGPTSTFAPPSDVHFVPVPVSPTTQSQPHNVVVGDFNGDGIADLAATNVDTPVLTVLLGKGDGTFTAAPSPQTGAGCFGLAIGDFNNDKRQDIVVVNAYNSNLTILLGDGAGNFTPASASPATGSVPDTVAIADFNHDGRSDLAVANLYNNNVTLLRGNGDGTFSFAGTIATGTNPLGIVAADFNGDHVPDLAIADLRSNDVTVALGNGDFTFSGSAFPAGAGPDSIASADFNGDGRPDLVISNSDSNNVTVLLGNGNGAFSSPPGAFPAAGSHPSFVATGDFNGDGLIDLALSNTDSQDVVVLIGFGNGTFVAAPSAPVGPVPFGVAVGDFNNDHRPDVVTVNKNGNDLTILLNSTTFPKNAVVSGTVFHDFNGNGRADPGERPLAGWTVFIDANGNGLLDSGETQVLTNSAGAYQFTGLAPGTYQVREVAKSGWVATATGGAGYTVVLAGVDVAGRDFGSARAASIAGSVFLDADKDGALDGTETGLAGVVLFLDANNNGVLDGGEASVTSNVSGAYAFNGLMPGAYVVRALPHAGQTQTSPSNGHYAITLVSDLKAARANFGYAV